MVGLLTLFFSYSITIFSHYSLLLQFHFQRKSIFLQFKTISSTVARFFFFFCFFLGPHLQHMEVPRLGIKSELQLPACTTATATPDLSRVCELHHNSWQHWILNPLSDARDRTYNLMAPIRICFCCTTTAIPMYISLCKLFFLSKSF